MQVDALAGEEGMMKQWRVVCVLGVSLCLVLSSCAVEVQPGFYGYYGPYPYRGYRYHYRYYPRHHFWWYAPFPYWG